MFPSETTNELYDNNSSKYTTVINNTMNILNKKAGLKTKPGLIKEFFITRWNNRSIINDYKNINESRNGYINQSTMKNFISTISFLEILSEHNRN